MDILGKAGLGGMCYPLMVGSCIVTFTLTSVFGLKERLQKIQAFAFYKADDADTGQVI